MQLLPLGYHQLIYHKGNGSGRRHSERLIGSISSIPYTHYIILVQFCAQATKMITIEISDWTTIVGYVIKLYQVVGDIQRV